jgi:hypothetical protein
VKRLKVRGQARGTQHGRVSNKWKHAFRHFDTSLGIFRTETEPRGTREDRHRDGCRILITYYRLLMTTLYCCSDMSQYFVIRMTALHGTVAQLILPAICVCVLVKRASVIDSRLEKSKVNCIGGDKVILSILTSYRVTYVTR